MSAVCGQHRQPAQLVVTYYEPAGDRFIRLDQLACNEGCGDPLLAGLDRSWFAITETDTGLVPDTAGAA